MTKVSTLGMFLVGLLLLGGCKKKPPPPPPQEYVRTFKGHRGVVGSLAFSPDGKVLASAGRQIGRRYGRTVLLRSFPQGKVLRRFTKHRGSVLAVAFSPDGKLLASGGNDRRVYIQESATGKLVGQFQVPGRVMCLAFSPDSKSIAVGDYKNNLQLWSVDGKQKRWAAKDRAALFSMRFAPGGKQLLTGGNSRFLTLWSADTGKLVRRFKDAHYAEVGDFGFSADNKYVVSCSSDRTVKVWDLATGARKHVLKLKEPVQTCDAHPKHAHIAASAGLRGFVTLHNIHTGKVIKTIKWYSSYYALRFAPDGEHLVIGNKYGETTLLRLKLDKKK